MIINYTGKTIIVNFDEKSNHDYSLIENYSPNKSSIILADAQKAETKLTKNTNIYIMSEDCKYIGHFSMRMMQHLPTDPIIYVGIRKGEEVWLSHGGLYASDVDFGLAKTIDQSKGWIMFLNPFFFLTVTFILLIVMVVVTLVAVELINVYVFTPAK